MLEWLKFALVAALLASGLFILASGVLGVYKFKFVLNRMHAAAMGDTLGLLLSLAALTFCAPDGYTVVKMALVVGFLWTTSPVNSHLIARLVVTAEEDIAGEMEVMRK